MGSPFALAYDIATFPCEVAGLRQMRRRIVGRAKGNVLELGLGTGANFPFYPGSQAVVGAEWDIEMLKRARSRSLRLGQPAQLVLADAQRLPFRAATFDTALATLVLCTVPEPLLALEEVRRVLRPGGTLLLLEHVRVPRLGVGRLQDLLTPLWGRVAGGCHLNRDTLSVVREAGFRVQGLRSHLKGLVLEIQAVRP